MKNPSLLPLVVVLLLAVSLLATTAVGARLIALVDDTSSPYVECEGDGGVYAANSTYEANRRRLAGLLLAEADAPGSNYYTDHAVGYWPNRPQAIFFCRHRRRHVDGASSGDDSACAACIAGAFLEVERECPYHRKAAFYSSNCTLEFSEFRIFGTEGIFNLFEENVLKQILASGLIFQGIGFGWLFFLLFQEWRSRTRGTMMHSTPLLSGD
ncbi:putative cysteine-rich receptor-like protein kinase 9 [Panicum virgatum]|uniref:Gnk2-homologous domain-containing protein n=1 Tax=Panicum virgatum TaxID=38727 RepID=A0A8T0WF92_PANVG|nr:putative cysteine-rich receptor-like protein kinase 9 [Panicum virgatum]KAG2645868.1 hypothetical protein PVAP13_2KG462700 [Panicum virgatum]